MAKGILVRHEVNAQFTAALVEDLDFSGCQRAPALPDGFVFFVGERVLGVKLQLIDLEICQFLREIEQGFQLGHATARDIEHHAASREVRPVADFQAGQLASVFAEQLPQGRLRRPQAAIFTKSYFNSALENRQRVAFGMIGRLLEFTLQRDAWTS